MQTAVGVFGNEDKQQNIPSSPSIVALEVARDRNIESEEDNLWRPDVRESEEEIFARGLEFMKWLWKRPEKEVAVVSHGIVRHAQGIHNVVLEEKRGIDEIGDVHLSPKLFDAPLSPKGVQQVSEQHKQILESGLLNTIELVITSPLR
ncbi:hypothetical protein F2Q68_00040576, partial [Brassica cretica]